MENFDDGFGDLSGYKILSFEEVTQGFEGNKNPLQGIANKSFEEKSFFKNSPFGQFWEKKIPQYALANYGFCLPLGNDSFRIFDLSKKISQTQTRYYESLKTENWDDIYFIVYANPDGKQVLDDYANTEYEPADNEVLFFIETNDGKFDFGKIVRVKLGKKAIEKLRFQFPFLGETDEEKLAEEFLKRPFEIKYGKEYEFFNKTKSEVEYAPENIKDLLVKAIKYDYDQKKFDDMSWFMLFLQAEDYIGLKLPIQLMKLSQSIRNEKYKEEKFWNANLEKGFTPAFLPDHLVPENRKDLVETIKKFLQQKIDRITNQSKESGVFEKVYNEILDNVLVYLFKQFSSILDEGLKIVDNNLPEGEVLDDLYNLNAFLVGLWNGCLELVAGIIDLAALIMKIARDGAGFVLTDAISETFENLLNAIVYGFEDFIKKLWKKFIHAILKFQTWYLKYGNNSYFWYKLLGELTPDIITILAPELVAAKASKAAEVTKIGTKASGEISEEVLNKTAKELSEKLEQKTAQKEVKESFENAEVELENRIPKQTEIEEVKLKFLKKLKLRPSWLPNRVIATKPNETVTLLGNYMKDTKRALEELDYPKSTNFGAKNGDFNLLNVDDELAKKFQLTFWEKFNQPWLEKATGRGDDFIVLSNKFDKNLLYNKSTGELTGFGREIQFMDDLVKNGIYKFVEEEGRYIKIKKQLL